MVKNVKNVRSVTEKDKKLSKLFFIARIGFGIVWAIDAAFKYEPAFYHNLLDSIKAKDSGEPHWLNPWFHFWYHLIGVNQGAWSVFIIIIETAIALSLLFGVARRLNYILGAVFSFLIWGVGEAFGGPYVAGTTDLNAGIIYVLLFIALYGFDMLVIPRYCLDKLVAQTLRFCAAR
jgi:thiosulfate dehydrogenase [quinone] large subunit